MNTTHAEPWPVRLLPGQDLKAALQAQLAERGLQAGFVLAGIGSLCQASLRLAGAPAPEVLQGDLEILTLCGTLGAGGAHLHASVADATGRVLGGHVATGCTVRTTVEALLLPLPAWHFDRAPDARTGFAELQIHTRPNDTP